MTEERIPQASTGATTRTTTPTTLTVSTEEIPLAETGESLSGYTLAGVLLILAAAIVIWKRQAAKGNV